MNPLLSAAQEGIQMVEEQKHTPRWRATDASALKGDWTCYDDDAGTSTWQPIVNEEGRAVAFVVDSGRDPFGSARESFDADARLIAASPDLLEALRQAEVGLVFAGADKEIEPGDFVPAPTLALRIVRAALSKAGA